MTIQNIRSNLGAYAKDIKLNLGSVLTEEGAEGLTENQIYGTALACAYATKNKTLIDAVAEDAYGVLSEAEVNAVQSAATLMAMNNIYYRFIHLVHDDSFGKMPANLRMSGIANHGIDKIDYEIYSLAVSAINGCGMCMDAHVDAILKAGGSKQAVQSSIRIASVINATAQAIVID
ncbi:MAG: alkyl hydroperoxide reductase subunit D [bacterium]|jgi:alkyl hydroperoxide reductase subunit D